MRALIHDRLARSALAPRVRRPRPMATLQSPPQESSCPIFSSRRPKAAMVEPARYARFSTPTRRSMCLANALLNRAFTSVASRSEEHTFELQSRENLVCRLLLEKKKKEDHK